MPPEKLPLPPETRRRPGWQRRPPPGWGGAPGGVGLGASVGLAASAGLVGAGVLGVAGAQAAASAVVASIRTNDRRDVRIISASRYLSMIGGAGVPVQSHSRSNTCRCRAHGGQRP